MQKFGSKSINPAQIFLSRKQVYGMVNLKPIVPGHVLVCTVRRVGRYADLTQLEIIEMWVAAKQIGEMLQSYYKTQSISYAIQDGLEAGQTIDHVHLHIIPRVNESLNSGFDVVSDSDRNSRTEEEMAEESSLYRKLLE